MYYIHNKYFGRDNIVVHIKLESIAITLAKVVTSKHPL